MSVDSVYNGGDSTISVSGCTLQKTYVAVEKVDEVSLALLGKLGQDGSHG